MQKPREEPDMEGTTKIGEKFDVGGVLLDRPFKIRRLGHFGSRNDDRQRRGEKDAGHPAKDAGTDSSHGLRDIEVVTSIGILADNLYGLNGRIARSVRRQAMSCNFYQV